MPTLVDDEEICTKTAIGSSRPVEAGSADDARSLVRTTLRLWTAVLGITTTKAIMLRGYHYPARLLSMHILAALVWELGQQIFYQTFHTNARNLLIEVGQSAHNPSPTRIAALLVPIIEAVCLSGSLICEYQSMLHFATLPALTMLLALQLSIVPASIGSAAWMGFGTSCVGALGMMLICVQDPHLTWQTGFLAMGAVLLANAARVLHTWGGHLGSTYDPGFCRVFFLAIGLACALGTVAHAEWRIYTPLYLTDCSPLLAMSIGSGVILLRTEFSFFGPRDPDSASAPTMDGRRVSAITWPVILSGTVTMISVIAGFDTTISIWQYAGFGVSLLAMHLQTKKAFQNSAIHPSFDREVGSREKVDSRVLWQKRRESLTFVLVVSIILLALPLVIYLTTGSITTSFTSDDPPRDSSRTTNSTFDIIISRCSETSDVVTQQLRPLLRLPSLLHQSTRIIVYDTSSISPNPFQVLLREALTNIADNVTVEHRANIGREAGAFLHHMSTKYTDLADHTLFMQAKAHNFPQILRRIDDYFVPNTGFLPLSDMQHFCNDCEKCWDHSTWSESREVLEMIIGESCRPFAMTYRGQFLVSRERIQARGRQHYDDLLRQLSDPKSETHGPSYTDQPWMPGKVDSINNPRLGFTLERAWATMMGCGDRKLVDRCPSLPAGWLRGELGLVPEKIGACQCLDGE